MKIAYFDCFSGLSGDMSLGALLACGADETRFRAALETLGLPGYELRIGKRTVSSIVATDIDVVLTETDTGHGRHLSDIAAIYRNCKLSKSVQETALAIFTRLAEAEAKIHGTTPEQIHFHEVGAIDSIVDITGVCILLEMLEIEAVYSAPLPLGRGFVKSQHGLLPLPAPATLELLLGLPTYPVPTNGEFVTPTGAAILATLAGKEKIGEMPPMRPLSVGYGAGKKDFGAPFPNLLRVIVGESEEKQAGENIRVQETIVVLETNVDDATPEILGYAQERLFATGALDVFLLNAQMKKNRPGTLITVLAQPDKADELTKVLFQETGTFGIRRTYASRDSLEREWQSVDTTYGVVRVKLGRWRDTLMVVAPEYEDCRTVALQNHVSLQEVYAAALQAWRS